MHADDLDGRNRTLRFLIARRQREAIALRGAVHALVVRLRQAGLFGWTKGRCNQRPGSNGGNPCGFSGPITGSGKVEILAGGLHAPLVFDGKTANTMRGTWSIKSGRVELAKEPGNAAMSGTIIVGENAALAWNGNDQLHNDAHVQLLSGASLNLNGFRDTIARLTLAAGTKILTDGPHGSGVLAVRELTVNGKAMPTLSSLDRLARALQVDISALLRDAPRRHQDDTAVLTTDPFLAEIAKYAEHLTSAQKSIFINHVRELAQGHTRRTA